MQVRQQASQAFPKSCENYGFTTPFHLYRPTTLKAFLKTLKTSPKKSLSQNFLIDKNILDKIIVSAKIKPKEPILEIGPGPGVLTDALLNAKASVIAIEKDLNFYHALKRWNSPELTPICGDVLNIDLKALLKTQIKVVANLPYHITGIFLQKFLPLEEKISSLILMVQYEIAERILAKKGTKNYSSLTLFVQFYAKAKFLFKVKPTSFYPKPKVNSALIELTLKKRDPKTSSPLFLIRKAFNQRRKTLRNSLSAFYPPSKIGAALTKIGHSSKVRSQELSLEDFHRLHLHLLESTK